MQIYPKQVIPVQNHFVNVHLLKNRKKQGLRLSVQNNLVNAVGRLSANVLALGAVADFGVENRQFTTKADAMHNVELTTKPAIEPNACYRFGLLSSNY